MKLVFCTICLVSLQAHAAVEGREQFDKAYKKFWSKPVNNWNKIAETKKTETYIIRRKDTLSELSEVFFGTPNYWPKIWSLNDYIGNPHLIYPGNTIGFYLGSTDGGAPQVFVGVKSEEPGNSIYALDDPEVKIPPDPKNVPVLNDLPNSFPEWKNTGEDQGSAVSQTQLQFSKLDSNVMKFNLSSFLHQGDLRTYGEVEGFLNAEFDIAGSFDEVFIKPNEPLPVGNVYTLVKPRKKARTPGGRTLSDIRIYEYVGELKITGREDIQNGLVAGQVTRSFDLIEKGTLLISGRVPQYDLSYDAKDVQPVDAEILRGSELFGYNIMGVGQTVFISQGEKEGITAGSLIEVKQNRKKRNPQRKLLGIVNRIGVIKVVSSTPDVSTGIVVSSRDFIAPGDKSIK